MPLDIVPSACPHDCPSSCALEVERIDERTIGRVRGAKDNPYTAGVVCAKVARYAERAHHPARLTQPLRRVGPKGSGAFEPVTWDDALDIVAEAFRRSAAAQGPESVWPFYYAGTMGLLQRDGLERLRRAMGYSALGKTICSAVGKAGWNAAVGELRGVDPREMAEADLVVLWGVNAAATQVNVMTHLSRARRDRGTVIACVDPYRNATAAFADVHLPLRPGTDGALACAVMHVLFKEGYADRPYMARYADDPDRLEAHLQSRTPAWAAAITGLTEQQIVDFAHLFGTTKRSFIRLGYGFTRSRNGAVNMHAVTCLPTVTGAWQYRGGGATFSNGGLYKIDKTLIEGLDIPSKGERTLDMCRLGNILAGDADALAGGPPVTAMIVQNSNPAVVAPDTGKVRAGLMRDDLFLCVHEQFMTKTARLADVVLPATTFLEHPDIYSGGGHTFLQVTRPVIEPLADCRCNHDVLRGLAERLGADHPGFRMTAWEALDATLRASGLPGADAAADSRWIDCAPSFETGHFLDGFAHPGGRFRFAPDWSAMGKYQDADLPPLPDHIDLIEAADAEHPFRLITAPSHDYLNTTFNETPSSRKRQPRPTVRMHRDDCAELGLAEGDRARLGNSRGSLVVHVEPADGQQRGVVVVEGIHPDEAFEEGVGINLLVGEDPIPPNGGAAFHDSAVWIRPA